MIVTHSHATHQGGRPYQEDSYSVAGKFAAVADGLGGHAEGAKASKTAIDAAIHAPGRLAEAMKAAAFAVYDLAPYNAKGIRDIPGTTLILAEWSWEQSVVADVIEMLSIGDSKVYHHRGDETRMAAGFRDCYPGGGLSACLGGGFPPESAKGHHDRILMVPGDKLILTTDGCDDYFEFFVDLEGGADATHVVNESVRLAGRNADNATCVILECK